MADIQLVSPNLNTTGAIGGCLAFAENAFGARHGLYAYASEAYRATVYKESGNPPSDVSVPIWFSGYGGEGHVAIWVPGKGVLSSPWQKGTNHAWMPSIAETARLYGVTYVGWSYDISGRKVATATAPPAPASGTAQTIRRCYVRTQANTTSPVGGSQILAAGVDFQYSAKVVGQAINENGVATNLWYHSTKGNYVWAGNCKDV